MIRTLLTLITLLVFATVTFAGTTGKISGKVIDRDTKEPLIGANVIIMGKGVGAATDIDGEFFIINIPPGIYTIKVSMIGYETQVFEKIRVQVDLTTKLNVSLSSAAIDLGSEVLVVGKREIQKDLTSSERSFQSDKIAELPARDVSSILSLQAGVTRDDGGNIHIRGGRSSEVSYMVDGVQVVNPLDRGSGISIDDQSIEELKAITGTFNPEYGQALSGVVNIVTKKGSDKFSISATAYTGDHLSFDDLYSVNSNREWAEAVYTNQTMGYLPFDFTKYGFRNRREAADAAAAGSKPWLKNEKYLDSFNPIENRDLQLNVSGPIPGVGQLSYFVAGRYQYKPDYQMGRRYFMPWGLWAPVTDTVNTYKSPDGKLVPLGWYEGYSTQSKIFYTIGSVSLNYGLYFNKDHSYGGGGKYNPDGGRHYYTDRYTHIVGATYIFTPSTFLDVKGSFYKSDHKSYLYESESDYRYMPNDGGDFASKVLGSGSIEIIPNDYGFGGNDLGRGSSEANYYSFSGDLTSQVDKNNMIKAGVTIRQHELMDDNFSLIYSNATKLITVPELSSPYRNKFGAKPMEASGYIQDKIEFQELIINFGVRFDYFDPDGRVLADVRDPQIYSPFKLDHKYKNYTPTTPKEELVEYTVAERDKFWWKKVDPKYQLSPRLGFSFPITAEGVIHFSYGHFFQNPGFRYLYTNPNFWVTGAGAQPLSGNADLKAEKTVMYELGLQQQILENLTFSLTGFYRDIRDWIGTGIPVDTYSGLTYYSYVNKDNAVAKGITLSATQVLGDFNYSIDYTYMEAKGTSSDPTDAYNDINARKAPRVQLISLDWDQPHSLNFVAGYSKNGWGASLVSSLNSGLPYTPSFVTTETTGSSAFSGLKENSTRKPTRFNVDLRLSKTFTMESYSIQAICDVTNLFDFRNATGVYSDTGLPDFTLANPGLATRLVELGSQTDVNRNPGMYTAPRYIQIGIKISSK
ncbi:MAG: TonB-dependent receptor [Bacteroidetes bacterium]|nr:TonB-dependent receptor [Bacteroidota bacterium]